MATAGSDTLDTGSMQALLGPRLTAEQARMIYDQGPEAIVFTLLTLARRVAERPVHPPHVTPRPRPGKPHPMSSRPGRDEPSPKAAGPDIPAIAGPRRRTSTAGRSTPSRHDP